MKNDKIDVVLENIKEYFGFLFEIGFVVTDAQYFPQYMGTWIVDLASKDCNLKFTNDRNEISLTIAPVPEHRIWVQIPGSNWFNLQTIVYFISDGNEVLGLFPGDNRDEIAQYKRLATILNKYIDRIVHIFGKDYKKYREQLLLASKKIDEFIARGYTD
jgi:hypothetical protein